MNKETPYTIKVFDNLRDYWRAQTESGYRDKITDLTESHYPKFLAMGWTDHKLRAIFILCRGNWKTRLLHEVGHELSYVARKPYKHVRDRDNIMYPYFWRGQEDWLSILSDYQEVYGDDAAIKLRRVLYEK